MSISKWWNDVWFRESSYFDLAVVRILAVGLSLYVTVNSNYGALQLVLAMPDTMYDPLPTLKVLMLPWGWGARPDAEITYMIHWFTVLVGVFSLVGFRTNISLLLFTAGSVFSQSVIYGFGDMHHREAIMMIALLALSLSPSGRVLSLDNALGKGHNSLVDSKESTSTDTSPFAFWPLLLIQAFFSLMYISAVVAKAYGPGDVEWLNGFTLQYYMIQDGIRNGGDFALWLSQFHTLLYMAQIVVLAFQGTFWIVLFYPKAKWLYVPLGLFFHLFILFSLQAPFYHWIILYSVFIPWSLVFERLNLKKSSAVTAST